MFESQFIEFSTKNQAINMYITFHEQLHLLHDEQPHDPIDHIHLLQDDEDNGSVNV